MKLKKDILTGKQAQEILGLNKFTFIRYRDKDGIIPYHTRNGGQGYRCKYYLRHEIEALIAVPPHLQITEDSSAPSVFNYYNDTQIRVQVVDRDYWFVAKDVCEALNIHAYRDAVSRLDEDERGSVIVDTLGGKQNLAAVNESGLYSLIFQSRKPEARVFRKWVTSEVLPSLRRTGSYTMRSSPKRACKSDSPYEFYTTCTWPISEPVYS